MELGKYRVYKETGQDDGKEVYVSLGTNFAPDFCNRHTIQIWDVSAVPAATIEKWVGATLVDRSLHEITITNNSNTRKTLTFVSSYVLADALTGEDYTVDIGPQGAAHFYATASLSNNNLIMTLREGSQDKRNL